MRPGRDPAARPTPRRCCAAIERADGVSYTVLIPNERGPRARAGALRRGRRAPVRRGQPVPVRERDAQPQERQPLDRGVAVGARAGRRAGARRRTALRGSDLGLVRLPVRGRGPADARVRDRASGSRRPVARRSRSATRPGWRTRSRCAASSSARGELPGRRADGAFPQHARPGTRERAGRARGGRRLVRELVRRARRLPGARRARPATSRPRTWSRCCTRWASRPGSTSSACSAARAGRRRCWGGRCAATC